MRLLVIGAVLVLGFALFVVAVGHNMAGVPSTQSASQSGASDASSSGTATADNPPALQVSVPELYQAYHANEVAADNEYKGKRLYLDAMVGSINKNAFGQVYLVLPNYYDEFDSVQAVLNEDSYGAAGRLQKGMIVSMECDGDGMIIGSPMLNNCSLVARRQAPPVPAPQPVAAEPAPDSAAPPQNPASSQGNTDTGNVQNTDTVKTEDPSPSK